MKIAVNEGRVAEATQTRKVYSLAELNKIVQDAAEHAGGPEAKAEQSGDSSFPLEGIEYTLTIPGQGHDRWINVAEYIRTKHQALGDLVVSHDFGSDVMTLCPASAHNLQDVANFHLSHGTSSVDYQLEIGELPTDAATTADALLRSAIAKELSEQKKYGPIRYNLTAEEILKFASPSRVRKTLKSLEALLRKRADGQRLARAGIYVYTVELGVFGFYGSSTRDVYKIKAPDMLAAVRAFVGEIGGFGATAVPDPLYIVPSAEELQVLKSKPGFDKRYVFESLEALFEREEEDAEHEAYERAVIRVEGGENESGFYDSSADDAYTVEDWDDDGDEIEAHIYKIDATGAKKGSTKPW